MKNIFIYLGAVLLIAGCFFTIISTPDDTLNFFDPLPVIIPDIPVNAMQYAGISIIAIAVVSVILSLINKTKFLWVSGVLTGGILTSVYFGFHSKLDEMKAKTDQQIDGLFGEMLKGLTDSLFQSVVLGGAGWYIISAGALLFIISPFIKKQSLTNKQSWKK